MIKKGSYILALSLTISISQYTSAQGMSGWSDKTVCRLAKSQADNQLFLDEAKRRNISCSLDTVKATSKTTAVQQNPLLSIQIPEKWEPIKNKEIFLLEANEVRDAWVHRKEIDACLQNMKEWDKFNLFEVNQKTARLEDTSSEFEKLPSHCTGKISLEGTIGYSDAGVSKLISDLFLHWAKNDEMSLNLNPWANSFHTLAYNTYSALGVFGAYYGLLRDDFSYTNKEYELVDEFFRSRLLESEPKKFIPAGSKLCNPNSIRGTLNGFRGIEVNGRYFDEIDINGCDSIVWKVIHGQIILGLRLGDEELFRKGIKHLKYQLSFFDKDGLFVPYSSYTKSGASTDYMDTVPHFLSVLVEVFDTIGYDFFSYKTKHGKTVKELYDFLSEFFENHHLALKYNKGGKGQDTYGDGRSTKEYRDRTPEEVLVDASYSWTLFVRQSPRYVETFRPELKKYIPPVFDRVAENGTYMDNIDNFNMIDPSLLYTANTANKADYFATQSTIERIKKNERQAQEDKEERARNTLIDISELSTAAQSNLEQLLKNELNTQENLNDLMVTSSKYKQSLSKRNATYKLKWYTLDKSIGVLTLHATDLLHVKGNKSSIETQNSSSTILPNNQRKLVKFNITPEGDVSAFGNLKIHDSNQASFLFFKGHLDKGFIIAPNSGDTLPLAIIKLDH